MHNLDGLRSTLGAKDGETVYEAAERVVRERDAAIAAAKSDFWKWQAEAVGKVQAEAFLKMDKQLAERPDYFEWLSAVER